MNTRYLKVLFLAFLLLLAEGCSFYAGFDVQKQTPQGTNKMVLNTAQQESARSN
jgi:hypothetical protein